MEFSEIIDAEHCDDKTCLTGGKCHLRGPNSIAEFVLKEETTV